MLGMRRFGSVVREHYAVRITCCQMQIVLLLASRFRIMKETQELTSNEAHHHSCQRCQEHNARPSSTKLQGIQVRLGAVMQVVQ